MATARGGTPTPRRTLGVGAMPKRFAVPAGAAPGEPRYDSKDFFSSATFEDAVDLLVSKLEVPMTWNYWQSFLSHLAQYYQVQLENKRIRDLYTKFNEERFGAQWTTLVPPRQYARQKSEGQPTGARSGSSRRTPLAKASSATLLAKGAGPSGPPAARQWRSVGAVGPAQGAARPAEVVEVLPGGGAPPGGGPGGGCMTGGL